MVSAPWRGFLAMAVLATACTFPEQTLDPGPKELVVHAVLDPSRSEQFVVVGYTHRGYYSDPVVSARVSITTPDGIEMIADSAALGRYRIKLASYGVSLLPEATYSLRVRTQDNLEVTGTTRIPNAVAVDMNPAAEPFNPTTDTLRMSAGAVPGAAASYEIQIADTHTYTDSYTKTTISTSRTIFTAFNTGSVVLAGTEKTPLDEDPMFRSGSTRLVVLAAVDSNYYAYYRTLADPYVGASPSRLTGGHGVFGSIVPLVVRRLNVR